MELLQLKYFQTVARSEHITKSAKELQIAQPALSMTIAKLEKEVGIQLFNRSGRNITLNEYGKIFLNRVNKSLLELETAIQEIKDLNENNFGSVTFISTSLNKQFSAVIGSFSIKYPNINLNINQIGYDQKMMNLLLEDKVDFAFINSSVEHPQIITKSLMEEEYFLAVSPKHHLANKKQVNLKELIDEPFVNLKGNTILKELYYNSQGNFGPNIICECTETTSLFNLVETGLGVAIFPCNNNYKKELPVTLINIEGIQCKSTLQLAWKNKYLSKAAIQFREYVIQHFS